MNNQGYWEVPENLDTSMFDFEWRPDEFEPPFIHQFGTQWQKTGGPRYVMEGAYRVKYQHCQRAKKLPDKSKFIVESGIDHVDFDWSWHPDETEGPYDYVFGNQYRRPEEAASVTYVNGSSVIKYMSEPKSKVCYKPLDIIYLSNGEVGEEDRFKRLCELSGRNVKWVRNINGRENAIRHSAEISETPWFILFPGKLWADESFDFDFQPLRHYEPKHYIFYAKNPLNGLVYGHQAAVCYNRQLVLETIDYGLDFTMSKLHDVVPVISGTAEYNVDPLITWRTSFREVIKLLADNTPESQERLRIWLNVAEGKNAEWSIRGAQDGKEYFKSVNGEHHQLMKSFSWEWLNNIHSSKYG